MLRYSVFIHEDVINSLPRSERQRRSIMNFISSLGDNPYSRADYTERDVSGRDLEAKIVDHYAILYWVDHAVKEVKVVHFQSAGK